MTGAVRELAMFPLGSVLFPGMPLALRVFEPRYLAMLESVLEAGQEFGVVLIERGPEVGGGDVRFDVGTIARVASVDQGAMAVEVVAAGTSRFEVVRWLQDDPFPRAEVREFPAMVCGPDTDAQLAVAEGVVRSAIARASEFVEPPWPADVELSEETARRLWQVAGIAPLSAMDQYGLLCSATASELLTQLVEDVSAAAVLFTAGWGSDDAGPSA